MLAPGTVAATDSRTPLRPCPQPCGTLTTPGIIVSVISTGSSIAPRAVATFARGAVGEPARRGVVGMDQQRAARRALHEPLAVVHPRVVRAQVAAADHHEPPSGAGARARGAADRRGTSRGASCDACDRACRGARAAAARAGRDRCRAARRAACERQAAACAGRAGAQRERRGSPRARACRAARSREPAADRGSRSRDHSPSADLPVVALVGARARTPAASTSRRCARRTRERDIVVRALERPTSAAGSRARAASSR